MAQQRSSIFAAQEHKRQERLREEAVKLKKQEEEIRRRQEEIAKELMASDMSVSSVDEVMVCQAREGQVFVGKKPHYLETVLDSNVVDVQQLNTSDWSSSDAESMQKDSIGDLNSLFFFLKSFQLTQNYLGGLSREIVGTQNILSSKTITPPFFSSTSFICNCHDPGGGSYKAAGENYDPPSFLGEGEGQECEVQGEEDGQWTGSSDEDTMEEELYECKVEVKQQNTLVSSSTLYNADHDQCQ